MNYYQPTSIREFLELSANLSDQTVSLLAGGTDMMPRYERGVPLPDHLIDLKKLQGHDSYIIKVVHHFFYCGIGFSL